MRALIVEDGFQRGALAACRALGTAGWHVGLASPEHGFAAGSRWARDWHAVPAAADCVTGLVDAVSRAVERGRYEIVFAAGDPELLALSERRERLRAVFPHSSHGSVERLLDKLALADAARRVGLAVPETVSPGGMGAEAGALVVKPRVTAAVTAAGGLSRFHAALAANGAEAAVLASRLCSAGVEPVVQRFVRGRLAAVVVVADRGSRVVARVQQEADALFPTGAGGSVRARTVPVDDGLAERTAALLAELGWFGLAQVQFVFPDRGEPVLIDANGRFYGSLALALAAGPNLPAIWAGLATGHATPPGGDGRPGVRYHWLEGDLRRLGGAPLARAPSGLVDTLAYARTATHGVWSRDDPRPGLRHAARLATRAVRRAVV
jgi:predicted ATP-grasp superfamily ATP-dependent carboligase